MTINFQIWKFPWKMNMKKKIIVQSFLLLNQKPSSFRLSQKTPSTYFQHGWSESWWTWMTNFFWDSIPRNESSCYPFEEGYQGLHRPLDRISSLVKYSLIPITLCYPRFRWISTTYTIHCTRVHEDRRGLCWIGLQISSVPCHFLFAQLVQYLPLLSQIKFRRW